MGDLHLLFKVRGVLSILVNILENIEAMLINAGNGLHYHKFKLVCLFFSIRAYMYLIRQLPLDRPMVSG